MKRPTVTDAGENPGLHSIGSAVFAAVVIGILVVTYTVSMAAYIFSGPLLPYLPAGAGMLLIGTCIAALTIALGSSVPGVISTPKGNVCAILALMGSAIVVQIGPEHGFATLAAGGLIGTLLTGALLAVLGYLRLGNLFRFVPYPVVGGYFAGAGFLLVKGAFPLLTALPLSLASLSALVAPDRLLLWVPAALLAAVLLAADRRMKHPLVIPIFLFGGIALFYLVLASARLPLAQARQMGLLMPDFITRPLWPPIVPMMLSEIDVAALAGQGGSILAIVFLSAISALLILSAIEIGTETDVDLDRDLRTAGIGNLLAAACGGLVCFQEDTDTILAHKLGARQRATGVLYALIFALVVLAGPKVITWLPVPVMGGIILYQGTDLLATWAWQSRRRLPPSDYLLVLAILAVVVFSGFVHAVAFGVVIAAVLFAVKYSRMSVVRHALNGAHLRSRVLRPENEQRCLHELGQQIYILTLQGYIFFGTTDRLIRTVRRRLGDDPARAPRFVVFDFRQVTNIDTSAVNSFVRLKQMTRSRGVVLVFADVAPAIMNQLQMVDYFQPQDPGLKLYHDLDHALEGCEDAVLGTACGSTKAPAALGPLFLEIFGNRRAAKIFIGYLTRRDFEARQQIFRQGDPADALYFVRSGKVTILLELGNNEQLRLQTLSAGTVFGEMGLYTGAPRSASAVAHQPGTLFSLSREAFDRLQHEQPAIAGRLHMFLGRSLSQRLAMSNETLQALIT